MQRGGSLVFHVCAQNAGIIIRSLDDVMRFEMFEVSAPNDKIMSEGKLACEFPGPAIDIPHSMSQDPDFISELSLFLSQMSSEAIPDAQPTIRKAGEEIAELRNTTNPRYITELLAGILRGIGDLADIQRIPKRIADEVHCSGGLPWRRSPFWLVLRVALQTTLYSSSQTHHEYKSFMVYLLAKILQLAINAKFPSDLIHIMHAKLSRRRTKLHRSLGPINNRLLEFFETTTNAAYTFRAQQWEKIQKRQVEPVYCAPDPLDFESDTILSLLHSRTHLERILAGKYQDKAPPLFHPSESLRYLPSSGNCVDFSDGTANLEKAIKVDEALALADFEESVETYLENWVTQHRDDAKSCASLAEYFRVYADAALELYRHNVEDQSIMLLTLFELWMAIDRLAVSQLPLLEDYHPEVSPTLIETLLLRTFRSTQRGIHLMKYCRIRAEGAKFGSVFSDTTSEGSLGVRYVRASDTLQHLQSRIVAAAQLERSDTIEKLLSTRKDYDEFIENARKAEHECGWRLSPWYNCKKCIWQSRAGRLAPPIHEWPLPDDNLKALNVIFELQAPPSFCTWRDITYRLVHDICASPSSGSSAVKMYEKLDAYEKLSSYNNWQYGERRIGLASSTASFLSRYYNVHPTASQDDVCRPSGLTFCLYDSVRCEWAAGPFSCNLSHRTTFQLPMNSPYYSLQFGINSTMHTSNFVLATQSECAQELDLNEFIAFGTLRAGGRLQWLNIAREIAAQGLRMERWEVQILMIQSAWQIGPVKMDPRDATPLIDWHMESGNAGFSRCMLGVLDGLHRRIQANWTQMKAVHTTTLIACRLLAFAAEEAGVSGEIVALLLRVRKTIYDWIHDLSKKLQGCTDEESISDLQIRLCEAAACCRATYDVEYVHIGDAFRTPEDVSIFIECAIVLCDNTPPIKSLGAHPDIKHLLDRERRLSRSFERYIVARISGDPSVLQTSLRTVWECCPANIQFEQLAAPNDRWFASVPTEPNEPHVHLNILSGQLLVDGRPLGRLPKTISEHPMFYRIFGYAVLYVAPTRNQRMPYALKDCFRGYHVTLGLVEKGQAIAVEAKDAANGRVFNLIPHVALQDDLPIPLIDSYAHWMERSTGHVQFRPLESAWDPTNVQWQMCRGPDGTYKMQHPLYSLLDIRSPTTKMISSRLASIEASQHLMVTLSNPPCRELSVGLPRYRLRFTLQGNRLLSKDRPGFMVDSDDKIGTFVGLRNRLVLAPYDKLYARRRVIVPCGEIHIYPSGDHVEITIDTNRLKNVSYHEYEVDEILCHLVDNGDMLSRFTKIYMHAITSFCLPDPLSGLTGTEMAIEELRSASCLSFQKLRDAEFTMLRKISEVAPQRKWYPDHLRVIQRTQWHSHLSSLSQHDDFVFYSSTIMQHAQRMLSGTQSREGFEITYDESLQRRAVSRRGWCYTASLQRSLLEDIRYTYGEREDNTPHTSEFDVASLSAVIYHPTNHVDPVRDLWALFKKWSTLNNTSNVNITYSHKWCKPKWPEIWLPLCRILRGARTASLLFTLSTAAYTSPRDRQTVHTLLALATDQSTWGHTESVQPVVSEVSVYDLGKGTEPDCGTLEEILRQAADFEPCESGENERPIAAFKTKLESQVTDAARQLVNRWPCGGNIDIPRPRAGSSWLFNSQKAMPEVRDQFAAWYRNHILYKHIVKVQCALNAISSRSRPVHLSSPPGGVPLSDPQALRREKLDLCALSLLSLIAQRTPPSLPPPPSQISGEFASRTLPPTPELNRLFAPFQNSSGGTLRQKYGEQLEASRQAMARHPHSILLKSPTEFECEGHVIACEKQFDETRSTILNALQPTKPQQYTFSAGLWPRLTSRTILGLLSHTTISYLGESWRDTIMRLAYSLLVFQRARRLHLLKVAGDGLSLEKELENLVPENERNPDWQLIQIEGNFAVRATQRSVAEAMIEPQSGRSTLKQLQMGEGKSSVIVPLVAAHLSNGAALVRVIVPKPLVPQMFRLLARRLSGLAQRRIYYMPISRNMKIDTKQLHDLRVLWEECVQCRGALIAQPEHILSFKLMVADHHVRLTKTPRTPPPSVAPLLLNLEKWLSSHSRDILDESDEILRVKYQVVYTMGLQEAIYDYPSRWLTIQCVLSRVRRHIPTITKRFPRDITVEQGNEDLFPRIRSIGASAMRALINAIVEDALDGELITCPQLSRLSPHLRQVAKNYATQLDLSPDVSLLCSYCGDDSPIWKTILLLRGLLAHRVLSYALGERWYRIDYGLAPERSVLAVPYLAKDVPSPRAEFGHPDVCIILTCLSYHCGGLTAKQVDQCFHILHGLDHRKQEFDKWVQGKLDIPEYLHDLDGVNLKDPEQHKTILNLFSDNHAVIDFFLSHAVFPKGAKEFPKKMATSGWDLVESKEHITTGFSGTNDNRFLLPTSIEQEDELNQQGTNAQVIRFLLQPESNNYTALPADSDKWLGLIADDPDITVLLDVGALMLDYSNSELARRWLHRRPEAKAIIFFVEDEISVMPRDGTVEPFTSSPYSQRLGECLVYLDDEHTRGTDLKLPRDACAAVTLGSKIAKDRLVQGCMRMRQLGKGQYVKFFAPVDIDQKIKHTRSHFDNRPSDPVGAIDVLRWAILETCADLARSIPHWIAQGLDYQNRKCAWEGFMCSEGEHLDELSKYWLQPDAKSLKEMYEFSPRDAPNHAVPSHHPQANFSMIEKRCSDLGLTLDSVLHAHLDEEQEREVDVEMEQEQQIERPPRVAAARHVLADEVRHLIGYGRIKWSAFVILFEALNDLNVVTAASAEATSWTKKLIATKDFANTVSADFPANTSDYIRPINWILSLNNNARDGSSRGCLVVLSPFEANELLPSIRQSKFVHLHMYSPRVMHNCISFETLEFYTIPRQLSWTPPDPYVVMQLNLMAGQLYVLDFATYGKLLDFLGLVNHTCTPREDMPAEIAGDGFVLSTHRRGRMRDVCPFTRSPIPFVKEIAASRRKGMSYLPTHLGKILITSPLTTKNWD